MDLTTIILTRFHSYETLNVVNSLSLSDSFRGIFSLINETDRRAGIKICVLLFPPTISTIVPNDFRVSKSGKSRLMLGEGKA